MLLSYALDAGRNGHGMDELCNLHLKHCPVAFKDVCGTGKFQITFDKAPLDRATCYAAADADVTLRLWRRLRPRLARAGLARGSAMVDRPRVPRTADRVSAGPTGARVPQRSARGKGGRARGEGGG